MFRLFILLFATSAMASDIVVAPFMGVSYGVNQVPYMQSFTATAANVVAGPELRDNISISGVPNNNFPSLSPLNVTVKLYEGEGNLGPLLSTDNVVLTADNVNPTAVFADVDYYAKGISLTVGKVYTLEWFTTDPVYTNMNTVNWWAGTSTSPLGQNDPNGCYLVNGTNTAYYTGATSNAGGAWIPVGTALPGDIVQTIFGIFPSGTYEQGNPGMSGTIWHNHFGCENGQAVQGDWIIHVIDQTPAPAACAGTAEPILGFTVQASKSGKYSFFTTPSNRVYVPAPTDPLAPVYSFINGALQDQFLVGESVTYSGNVDPTGVFCMPTSVTVSGAVLPTATPVPVIVPPTCALPQVLVNGACVTPIVASPTPIPAPPASCVKPAGAKSFQVQDKITATGPGTITIGATVVTVPGCVITKYKGTASTFGIGYDAEVTKGYTLNGVNYATSLIVDDGK